MHVEGVGDAREEGVVRVKWYVRIIVGVIV